ncbi:MAG TPA: prepilin-type N-terminal cleavage/methylation domain-containing protein [Tepidisphaeraceae bacterium]|jgi:Tfp pilus assembly protein PilW|nr:prepilin-type N-terminal cleavage/methylation domain-containing protein [Tepidisphaeraceae bacterium]
MKHATPRRDRGLVLIELMIVLSILMVFGVVAVRVTHVCLTVPQKAAEARSAFERFDFAVGSLRLDIWAADGLHCPDDKTLEIGAGKTPAIVWRVESGGVLTRTAATSEGAGQTPSVRRWDTGRQIQFAANGPTVTLSAKQDVETARTELMSQRMLLAGGTK